MSEIPKTLQEAIDMGGWEDAPLEDFNRALASQPELHTLREQVDCRAAPPGTVCTYVPCFEGWEYISTCFERVCKPAKRRRC